MQKQQVSLYIDHRKTLNVQSKRNCTHWGTPSDCVIMRYVHKPLTLYFMQSPFTYGKQGGQRNTKENLEDLLLSGDKIRIMSLWIQMNESVGIFVETIMVSSGWEKTFQAASCNGMSVSIEEWRISCRYPPKKQSIKAPANPQIYSCRRIIIRSRNLSRTSKFPPQQVTVVFSSRINWRHFAAQLGPSLISGFFI